MCTQRERMSSISSLAIPGLKALALVSLRTLWMESLLVEGAFLNSSQRRGTAEFEIVVPPTNYLDNFSLVQRQKRWKVENYKVLFLVDRDQAGTEHVPGGNDFYSGFSGISLNCTHYKSVTSAADRGGTFFNLGGPYDIQIFRNFDENSPPIVPGFFEGLFSHLGGV